MVEDLSYGAGHRVMHIAFAWQNAVRGLRALNGCEHELGGRQRSNYLFAPDCRPSLIFDTSMHTKEFIEEMKQRLLEEKQSLKGELKETEGFPDYGRSEEENATEVADFQARSATSTAASERLDEIDAALARIEDGAYGTSEDGALIPEERLRANPAATTIIA